MFDEFGTISVETEMPVVMDNPAKQPVSTSPDLAPAQLLVGIVQHNLNNPENRITLSVEQGNKIRQDFDAFLAESSDTPTTEDGTPLTFNEMNDTQLEKCLSEYLGSGIVNYSINGALIEGAQDLMAELYMSDEELEELPNPKTAKGQQARERKILDRIRDAAEAEAASQAKWEKDVWSNQTYDVGNLKLTGKQIDAILNDLADSKKREKLAEDYKNKYGGTTDNANQVLSDTEKYLKAKKRYEYLKATNQLDKMTPEEKVNLELIKTNPKIEKAVELIEAKSKADLEYVGPKASAEITADKIAVASDDRKSSFVGMSSSAVNQYELADDGIKSDKKIGNEFNILGNPETAVAALEAKKVSPQVQLAAVSQTARTMDAELM